MAQLDAIKEYYKIVEHPNNCTKPTPDLANKYAQAESPSCPLVLAAASPVPLAPAEDDFSHTLQLDPCTPGSITGPPISVTAPPIVTTSPVVFVYHGPQNLLCNTACTHMLSNTATSTV